MRAFFRKPTTSFFLSMIVITAILFLVPINIFDGEILFEGRTQWEPFKISLSNFVGIGTEDAASQGVIDFRLVGMGYLLAGLLIVAFPLLIAYRVHIANVNEERRRRNGETGKR